MALRAHRIERQKSILYNEVVRRRRWWYESKAYHGVVESDKTRPNFGANALIC